VQYNRDFYGWLGVVQVSARLQWPWVKGGLAGTYFLCDINIEKGLVYCRGLYGEEATVGSGFLGVVHGSAEGQLCCRLHFRWA